MSHPPSASGCRTPRQRRPDGAGGSAAFRGTQAHGGDRPRQAAVRIGVVGQHVAGGVAAGRAVGDAARFQSAARIVRGYGSSSVPATATLSVVVLVALPSDTVTMKLSDAAALVALMAPLLGTKT